MIVVDLKILLFGVYSIDCKFVTVSMRERDNSFKTLYCTVAIVTFLKLTNNTDLNIWTVKAIRGEIQNEAHAVNVLRQKKF